MKLKALSYLWIAIQPLSFAEETHSSGSRAVDSVSAPIKMCILVEQETRKKLSDLGRGDIASVNRDGSRIIYHGWNGRDGVYDTATQRLVKNLDYYNGGNATLSQDGKSVAQYFGKRIEVSNLETGETISIAVTSDFAFNPYMLLSPDGKYLAVKLGSGKLEIYQVPSKEKIFSHQGIEVRDFSFSPSDGKYLSFRAKETLWVLDLERKELFPALDGVRSTAFSKDGSTLFVSDQEELYSFSLTERKKISRLGDSLLFGNRTLDFVNTGWELRGKYLDLRDGTVHPYKIDNRNAMAISHHYILEEGFLGVGVVEETQRLVFYEPSTGRVLKDISDPEGGNSYFKISSDGKKLFLKKANQGVVMIDPPKIMCFSDTVLVNATSPVDPMALQRIKSGLCREAFSASQWDSITPLPGDGEISNELAQKFLLRFQKVGGLDPKVHLPLVMGMTKNEAFCRSNPSLVSGMLVNLFSVAPAVYEKFISDYPWLSDLNELESSGVPAPTCRTQEEETHFISKVLPYVEELVKKNETKSQLSTWKPLFPLRAALSKLTPDQKDALMHTMVIGMTADAKEKDKNLKPIFDSKLAHLILPAIAPIFGENSKRKTNLNVENEHGILSPVLLSTDPITEHTDPAHSTGQIKNPYGFYVLPLPKVRVRSTNLDQEVKWKTAGKEYTAQIHAAPISGEALVNQDSSIPYEELMADNELTGMVLVGSNSVSEAGTLLTNYQQFYTNLGYHFSSGENTEDVPGKFAEMVKNGNLDYFLKEAHSDGDEMNLFRMLKTAKTVTGERTRPDGKKEKIHLMYPGNSATRGQDHLLSNQEFGSWMKERVRNGKGTLVYINSSCWALKNKIPNETAAAGTSKLYNIGAPTCADGLTTLADNQAMYQLLTGFLAQKTNEEIREGMRKDPFYVKKSWDHYVFPDESIYEDYVLKKLEVPIDIKIDIKDETGAPYHFDVAR